MMMRCVPSPPRRLRFLRYKPGEYFRPHRDGSYCREDHSEFSVATIMFYLNEDMVGGSTTFLEDPGVTDVDIPYHPRTGSVVVFAHQLYHEGEELREGVKYACRTDLMVRAA